MVRSSSLAHTIEYIGTTNIQTKKEGKRKTSRQLGRIQTLERVLHPS
uniref:Uncharacterized protein n=1 Tax=Rhizophora mucronata TaxID=61149 RepID=A0A2P2R4U3_RHIMU